MPPCTGCPVRPGTSPAPCPLGRGGRVSPGPCPADGTPCHTVNKANRLLTAPSRCQAGAGSSALARPLRSRTPRRCKSPCAWVIGSPHHPQHVSSELLFLQRQQPWNRVAHGAVTQPPTASWALSLPPNLSLKTPPRCRRFPAPGDASLPPPHFPHHPPPAPRPGQDVPTWPRVPRAGWGRPRSHGTDPLRMLQPGHPQPLAAREEPTGFSLGPPCPPQARPAHRVVWEPQGCVWWVCAASPQEGVLGAARVGEAAGEGAEMGRGEGRDGEQAGGRSPISAGSPRQPGHSHDFVFCFLITLSTGPFRTNYKPGTGGNQTWDKPPTTGILAQSWRHPTLPLSRDHSGFVAPSRRRLW